MIGEFAFTPSVFDEQANPDAESWREQLRELGNAMFPKTAAWPVMIANLYDGSWQNIAMTTAEAVKESKSRILCEGILKNIGNTLVHRPIAESDWPNDDLAWGREAIASHAIEPIDRIVSCRAVQDTLTAEGHPVRCISEVQGDGFWRDISSQWDQPLTIPSQVQAIRKLTLHAEFLCLITPHVRGTGDDETDFTLEMIRSAFRRPTDFPSVEIEVHSEGPDNPTSADFRQRLKNAVGNTTTSVLSALRPAQSVRLVLWPKLLDRYLIAGVYTSTSGGARMRSPRWGLSMQHIARRVDAREAKPPTSWSLLTRSQLGDVFTRYCSGTPTGTLTDIVVTGR
jgi:hypothetical protein